MRTIKAKIQRIINNYFYNKINRCKKCGSKGCLTKSLTENYNKWHIICLGKCTNHTELHKTRSGAIKEWNEQENS